MIVEKGARHARPIKRVSRKKKRMLMGQLEVYEEEGRRERRRRRRGGKGSFERGEARRGGKLQHQDWEGAEQIIKERTLDSSWSGTFQDSSRGREDCSFGRNSKLVEPSYPARKEHKTGSRRCKLPSFASCGVAESEAGLTRLLHLLLGECAFLCVASTWMNPKVNTQDSYVLASPHFASFLPSGSCTFLLARLTRKITPRRSSPPVASAKMYSGTQVPKYLYE